MTRSRTAALFSLRLSLLLVILSISHCHSTPTGIESTSLSTSASTLTSSSILQSFGEFLSSWLFPNPDDPEGPSNGNDSESGNHNGRNWKWGDQSDFPFTDGGLFDIGEEWAWGSTTLTVVVSIDLDRRQKGAKVGKCQMSDDQAQRLRKLDTL